MNNKGFTMILLVVVIALIISLSSGLLNHLLKHYNIKVYNTESKQAFYMAETALNEAYVEACILIDESIIHGKDLASAYLDINPSDKSGAASLFITSYKANIRNNIKDRLDRGGNPSIDLRELKTNDVLTAFLRASSIYGNVEELVWVDLIIRVPDFYDIIDGSYKADDYIDLDNWAS